MELDKSAVKQNIMSKSQSDLTFKIGSQVKLSQIFLKLNELKSGQKIKDFTMSLCSLENIFIKFVRLQKSNE